MEHLTREQLGHLRELLERAVERLQARIAYEREKAAEDEAAAPHGDSGEDEADRAFAELRAGIQRELLNCHVAELQIVEAARARIEAGDFGLCLDYGTPIPYARLEAQPSAERCARCQSLHEKTFANKVR